MQTLLIRSEAVGKRLAFLLREALAFVLASALAFAFASNGLRSTIGFAFAFAFIRVPALLPYLTWQCGKLFFSNRP